jgi:hypothetical protein
MLVGLTRSEGMIVNFKRSKMNVGKLFGRTTRSTRSQFELFRALSVPKHHIVIAVCCKCLELRWNLIRAETRAVRNLFTSTFPVGRRLTILLTEFGMD